MKKVVIMESLGVGREELDALEKPFEALGVTFARYPRTADPEALVRQAADADAVIIANMPFPAHVIRRCEKLKFIDVAFTGVDHVGLEAARERGITVSNASGYSNEAVSELVLGMALSLLRNIPQVQQRCRAGLTKEGLVGGELRGKTVGVIGFGRIGRRPAELVRAFGCPVLAHSRHLKADAPDWVEQVSREELLRRSDIVVLHCPLNDSTRGMIDYAALRSMKPTALLINVARGPVVVEKDLARALAEGVIAGAAVDVFDVEPPLPPETPLLHAPHALLTPHVAFATAESMTLRAEIVFDNLRAWLAGEPKNVVL
jgi:D-3-phosphoglycerate dehydrogenase